jgi:hypothetical protein
MKFSSITENRINFSELYMTIGLSVGKKTGIFINDDELNAETTLESLFSSPIVPIVTKTFILFFRNF